MKSYTSTTLITFNSWKGSMFQASHASHSWEAVNNHMRSCKSLDKPAEQDRNTNRGGFELKYSSHVQETY